MSRLLSRLAPVALLALSLAPAHAADPQPGGTARIYQRDNPASASLLEEATYSTNIPFMSIYNNLIRYKQDAPQNSDATIEPELATSWSWNADKTALTLKLRQGVKWHDGQPFTAKDVKCTFDLIQDKGTEHLRKNPRKFLWHNLQEVVPNGDYEVTLKLGRPQPSLIALLASGYSAMYPCHVSPAQMRTHPIGTGPFMLADFKQNEIIRLVKNPNYWKPGRPYLDEIDMPIMTDRATAMLAFMAHKIDMTFPLEVTPPILRDINKQVPTAQCAWGPQNVNENLIVNRDTPPFDNPDIRRAMALTLDRKAFIDILFEGKADIGGALLPAPEGVWGMPKSMMESMTGYNPDIAKNREEARALMKKAGYGPDHHLQVKVSTRNIAAYRDPAVILIDQLKQIWIDGELEPVETALWFAKLARKDYAIGMNLTGNALDDPDQAFYENFACKSQRNYSQYCNPEIEKLFDQQSAETDVDKRRKLVWEIDQKLQNDVARPIILHMRGGTCWWPQLHGFTQMVNSSYNGYRYENLWIEH